MELDIKHLPEKNRFETTVDGFTAFVNYRIANEALDILHTVVPRAIEGQGIAAALVKQAYDYARANDMRCQATCSYAVVWLRRHPDYVD